ncbi:hypothetical protein GCM10009636_10580 [Arthrobacter koreensis]|uniref:hypothetical protein n=1 Tax=Arthrobacter koreensis TaxID=199136 RepID=UPI001264F821|nr:hypothetical protein [Arthrobacter koreensis]
MKRAREVLDPDSRKPFITLSWAGRNESAAELAPRVEATTDRVLAQYKGSPAVWFQSPTDLGQDPVHLPGDIPALTDLLEDSFDRTLGDYSSRTSLSLFVDEDPPKLDRTSTSLSLAVGSGERNTVTLRLTEDFPLGSPSQAARLLLDLTRIWRPDSAELMTISAARAALGKGPYNHVAYMLWASDKAYAPSPEIEGELVLPYGEGRLHVAREWTDQAVVALFEELGRSGTHRASAESNLQEPPHLKEGYPDQLTDLDSLVSWGSSGTPRLD